MLSFWTLGHHRFCPGCRRHLHGRTPTHQEVEQDPWKWYLPGCYGARLLGHLYYGYLPALSGVVRPCPKKVSFAGLSGSPELKAAWKKQSAMPGIFTTGDAKYISKLLTATRPMDAYRAAARGGIPKVRVYWDGRAFNEFVVAWKCRYEDFPAVLTHLEPDEWYTCFDLRAFYLGLPVHQLIHRYLSFRDPITGEIRAYRVLPFGLATAPTYASGISGEAALIIGSYTRCVQHVYLDDTLQRSPGSSSNAELGRQAANVDLDISLGIIRNLGLTEAKEKTVRATKSIKSLGYRVNSTDCTIEISEDHRAFTAKYIGDMVTGEHFPKKREFASLCGLMSFLTPAIRGAKSYLRPFWDHLKYLKNSKGKMKALPADLCRDLLWWRDKLQPGNFKSVAKWINPAVSDMECLWTDASGSFGAGAWFKTERYVHEWGPAPSSNMACHTKNCGR